MPMNRIWTKTVIRMKRPHKMHNKHSNPPLQLSESLGFKDLDGLLKPSLQLPGASDGKPEPEAEYAGQ